MADGYLRTIDLARAVGVSTQQVRDYEAGEMLPAVERHENGYRLYTVRHLVALRTIRTLRLAGYAQPEVRQVMQGIHAGNFEDPLALFDARHAVFDAQRRQLAHILEVIESLEPGSVLPAGTARSRSLHIGEAAKVLAVLPSTLRFWELEGLIRPGREETSGYRLYDQNQVKRLEIVTLLRTMNYRIEAIRPVLDDLTEMKTGSALAIAELRQGAIAAASLLCTQATVAAWNYFCHFQHDDGVLRDQGEFFKNDS